MKDNSQSKSVVKSEIFLTNYEISCLQELRYGAALYFHPATTDHLLSLNFIRQYNFSNDLRFVITPEGLRYLEYYDQVQHEKEQINREKQIDLKYKKISMVISIVAIVISVLSLVFQFTK